MIRIVVPAVSPMSSTPSMLAYATRMASTALEASVYNTARWQALRVRVLQRDGRRCWVCGARAGAVDHVVPLRTAPALAFEPSNLRAVCGACNTARSNGTRVSRYAVRDRW